VAEVTAEAAWEAVDATEEEEDAVERASAEREGTMGEVMAVAEMATAASTAVVARAAAAREVETEVEVPGVALPVSR
jgi:hypothetical protein